MNTQSQGLIVGAKLSVAGLTYIVTKTGVERLTGDRKERRAKEAELRKAGLV